MSPFIALNASHDDTQSVQSGLTSNMIVTGRTTPPLLAQIKSANSLATRGYNSASNMAAAGGAAKNTISSSSRHQLLPSGSEEKPPNKGSGISILSLQNGAKLPQASRKVKGIAIQKILESTQKPWFMLNGLEYSRPSPFAAPEPKLDSSI